MMRVTQWGMRHKPWPHLKFVLCAMVLLLGCHVLARAQAPAEDTGPMQQNTDVEHVHQIDNDTIVRMAKAGLDDTIILQTIELQPGHYDVTPDDLIALKKDGISQRVIAAMEAHGTGLDLRERRAALGMSPTPMAMGIEDPGVYYKDRQGEWIPLKTERVMIKSGGTIKNILSDGFIRRDMNGHVDGAKSPLKLPTGVEILIYAPPGVDATEYDFLRFREHTDNREFRTLTGGILHSESGAERDEIEFSPKRIAPQMYTFTVPVDIEKGEYGVLPPAAAGLQGTGKIYTFSIQE
jgi:hypothetical protein